MQILCGSPLNTAPHKQDGLFRFVNGSKTPCGVVFISTAKEQNCKSTKRKQERELLHPYEAISHICNLHHYQNYEACHSDYFPIACYIVLVVLPRVFLSTSEYFASPTLPPPTRWPHPIQTHQCRRHRRQLAHFTTISALTGKDGQDGQDGKDGTDGQNGTNGTNGLDGTNGQNGTNGQSGPQGEQGEQGIQGIQGTPGANGTDGQDGADGKDGTDGTNGIDGQDGTNGTDGIDGVNGTDGTDGREIELQKDLYFIQWRYIGEPGWRNLIVYAELKGDKGDTGLTGATGPANTLSIGTVTRTDCNPTASITGTSPAQTLNLGIPGLPTGGTTGQVLQKKSNTDCDVEWRNSGPQLLREIVWSGNDVARPIAVDEATGIFAAPGHTLKTSTNPTTMVTFRGGEADYTKIYARWISA